MLAPHSDVRSRNHFEVKVEFKPVQNKRKQNNTVGQLIYKTVFNEYYVEITAPAV